MEPKVIKLKPIAKYSIAELPALLYPLINRRTTNPPTATIITLIICNNNNNNGISIFTLQIIKKTSIKHNYFETE